jgi:phosphatidylserine/phosphatidylglycerophosphate/cardiolipin synthase-like enzyme
MAVYGIGRRVTPGAAVESLESRQLLAASAEVGQFAPGPPPRAPQLFVEPQDGRGVILQAIASAHRQIRLGICDLSDPIIGQALADAVARGVEVQVIVDRDDYASNPDEQALLARLATEGVEVHLSNPIFDQSFEKEMVIDGRTVLIMTMCLVPATFEDTRDYGLVLATPSIIAEVTHFFDNDWAFSAPPGVAPPPYNPTPPVSVPNLIWSPINASAKLTSLIQGARHTIDATTELLDDPYLESALIAAASRGVQVRLILPAVPRTGSNAAGIALLASHGVDVRVTIGQDPPVGALPYMHAKTMIVDGKLAYLGSIDLQTASTSDDRELGILFRQPGLIAPLRAQFVSDWALAQPVA